MAANSRTQGIASIAGVGGVIVLVIVIAFVIGRGAGQDDSAVADAAPPVGESDYGLVLGDPAAATEIVVYSDFSCPACAAFEEAGSADLAGIVADGTARLEFRPFDLLGEEHTVNATAAFATVLEGSGPEAAKDLYDAMFADQPDEGDTPDIAWYVERAEAAGGDGEAVRAAIDDGDTAWLDGATAEAEEVGINGTPTILLDGEVLTGFDSFEDAADLLVDAAESAG